MKYDKMWYEFKEQLMNLKNCGEATIDELLTIMNRIEVEQNKEVNKKLYPSYGRR